MEFMNSEMEIDSMRAIAKVRDEPLKAVDGVSISPEQLEDQAAANKTALREVDPSAPGTCVDERPRVGVLSGEAKVEPRFSAPGGPNIYGLYIGVMTGYFGNRDMSAKDRLIEITKAINQAGIPSGGHKGCAANAKFEALLGLIGRDNKDAGRAYAQENLGEDFDEQAYEEATSNALHEYQSGRFRDWSEDILIDVLGDEAGDAIEILEGDHEGWTLVRTNVPGKTVHQNALDETVGNHTFVNDDPYEDRIDNVIADGPDAAWKLKVARHAREALLAALVPALPNKELHQLSISI